MKIIPVNMFPCGRDHTQEMNNVINRNENENCLNQDFPEFSTAESPQ